MELLSPAETAQSVDPTFGSCISLYPRTINEPGNVTHPLMDGRHQSPLRYPGGKSKLAKTIGALVDTASKSRMMSPVELFVEPFAGGSSVALRLVASGVAKRVLLADADPMVSAFWQVAAADPEYLIDRIYEEHKKFIMPGAVTALGRWDYWKHWEATHRMASTKMRRELAVRCLFLNRTTFSGILHGQAGPIGGRKQSSEHKIDCRFNPRAIEQQLRFIGELYEHGRLVDVWCKDWESTLSDVSEWYPQLIPNQVVAYLDPPYIKKSGKLYRDRNLDWVGEGEHMRLAHYLRHKVGFRWVLSYDNRPELLDDPRFYKAGRMTPSAEDREMLGLRSWRITKRLVDLNYTASSATRRKSTSELLLTTLPIGSGNNLTGLRQVEETTATP